MNLQCVASLPPNMSRSGYCPVAFSVFVQCTVDRCTSVLHLVTGSHLHVEIMQKPAFPGIFLVEAE